MLFEVHKLQPPLDKYIESIFYFKDYTAKHSAERVIPTGHLFLLIELDGFERNTFNNEMQPLGKFQKSWVSGMHKEYINISVHANSEMLVIQFKPAGAFPFFKIPIHLLNNKIQPSEHFFGAAIHHLRDQISLKKHFTEKFDLVEHFLLQILDEKKSPPPDILDIVQKLQAHPFSKHQELWHDYSKTHKHLISQFKKYCGLTPKVLHRIFRFNRLLANINQKENLVWTDIVYEIGYTDQAHFIKEFQEFSGFNPSKFIRNGLNTSDPNFLPLN